MSVGTVLGLPRELELSEEFKYKELIMPVSEELKYDNNGWYIEITQQKQPDKATPINK